MGVPLLYGDLTSRHVWEGSALLDSGEEIIVKFDANSGALETNPHVETRLGRVIISEIRDIFIDRAE